MIELLLLLTLGWSYFKRCFLKECAICRRPVVLDSVPASPVSVCQSQLPTAEQIEPNLNQTVLPKALQSPCPQLKASQAKSVVTRTSIVGCSVSFITSSYSVIDYVPQNIVIHLSLSAGSGKVSTVRTCRELFRLLLFIGPLLTLRSSLLYISSS